MLGATSMLIQVKVLQVNWEERDSLIWTGLLLNLVTSIVQKLGKLSDQGSHCWLVKDGLAFIYYPKVCITCWMAWLLENDWLPMTDLNFWYQGDILHVFCIGCREIAWILSALFLLESGFLVSFVCCISCVAVLAAGLVLFFADFRCRLLC